VRVGRPEPLYLYARSRVYVEFYSDLRSISVTGRVVKDDSRTSVSLSAI